jgi:plastocyanin
MPLKLLRAAMVPSALLALLAFAAACDEGVSPTARVGTPGTLTPGPTGTATATTAPTDTTTATASETTAPTGSPTGAPAGAVVIDMGDNWFNGPTVQNGGTPGQEVTVSAPAGPVQIQTKNVGAAIHDIYFSSLDIRTQPLQAAGEEVLDLGTVAAGEYPFICEFHPVEMIGKLVVQ